ncbi:unnamed protein product [Lactuca virosa]|uniref:Uncharacterized protein n=1 Tax=Lactuca virosa TaxID=75947 RepID=A0AAU9LBY6_9ASTR|nr:unnamed protein product [Lactuca virosa]
MQEPSATLFSSQSTEAEKSLNEEEVDDDNFMVSLAELKIYDELIMSGKKLKILNSKMNSILQFLVDAGSKNSVSGVEVEYLLKDHESQLKSFIEYVDKRTDDRIITQSHTFNHEISKLCDVSKERHELFEKQLTEMKVFLENQLKEI